MPNRAATPPRLKGSHVAPLGEGAGPGSSRRALTPITVASATSTTVAPASTPSRRRRWCGSRPAPSGDATSARSLLGTRDRDRRDLDGLEGRWELQVRILSQDRLLERSEFRTGVDPELGRERLPGRLERGERLGLPAAPIQREHLQRPDVLTQGEALHERLGLRDRVALTAERQERLDARLLGRCSELLEPARRRLRERLIGEVGERGPAPHAPGRVPGARAPPRAGPR